MEEFGIDAKLEQKILKKARELVDRSKNPPHGLEAYPSDARSIERNLDQGQHDEVLFYFCDLARYEDGGVFAFCEWLAIHCPNMLSHNHTMWIMMEEDGVEFEKIREVYLKVDYDISTVQKETVIQLNDTNSSDSNEIEPFGWVTYFLVFAFFSGGMLLLAQYVF